VAAGPEPRLAVPPYDYQCRSCGFITEVVHSILVDGPTVCERCGGPLRRVIHPTGIIFKGGGFYKTDSRSSSTSTAGGKAKADAGASTPSSGDTKSTGDTSSGSKPSGSAATKGDGGSA